MLAGWGKWILLPHFKIGLARLWGFRQRGLWMYLWWLLWGLFWSLCIRNLESPVYGSEPVCLLQQRPWMRIWFLSQETQVLLGREAEFSCRSLPSPLRDLSQETGDSTFYVPLALFPSPYIQVLSFGHWQCQPVPLPHAGMLWQAKPISSLPSQASRSRRSSLQPFTEHSLCAVFIQSLTVTAEVDGISKLQMVKLRLSEVRWLTESHPQSARDQIAT